MIPLIIKDCLRRGIEAGVSEAVVVTGSPLVDCLGQARLSSLARRLSDYLGQARCFDACQTTSDKLAVCWPPNSQVGASSGIYGRETLP